MKPNEAIRGEASWRSLWSEGPWRREIPERSPVTGTQTPGQTDSGLDRVRAAAKRDRTLRMSNLMHHLDVALLRRAYQALNRKAARGVDGPDDGLIHTLCDHAVGNYRILTTMAAELLAVAAQRDLPQLDEKLYLEVFAPPDTATVRRANARR